MRSRVVGNWISKADLPVAQRVDAKHIPGKSEMRKNREKGEKSVQFVVLSSDEVEKVVLILRAMQLEALAI